MFEVIKAIIVACAILSLLPGCSLSGPSPRIKNVADCEAKGIVDLQRCESLG